MPVEVQTRPRMSWDMNINTLLTIGGFALTIITGAMAYQSFKSETEAWRASIDLQIVENKSQRLADKAQIEARIALIEASINALNVTNARNDERMATILTYVQRIDRKLEEPKP